MEVSVIVAPKTVVMTGLRFDYGQVYESKKGFRAKDEIRVRVKAAIA